MASNTVCVVSGIMVRDGELRLTKEKTGVGRRGGCCSGRRGRIGAGQLSISLDYESTRRIIQRGCEDEEGGFIREWKIKMKGRSEQRIFGRVDSCTCGVW